MKEVLNSLNAAHTNVTILETMLDTMRNGYHGAHGVERSEAFERKISKLIAAEQQRLLRVLDRHTAKILKVVQS